MKRLSMLLLILLSSCATHLKTTQVEKIKKEQTRSLEKRNFVFLVKKNNPVISGQHFEGEWQVPQPWIFGLSNDQKEQLRFQASELAAERLIAELKNAGIKILDSESRLQKYELWTIEVTQVEIDTYGNGYHGFGSAGNYWKAKNTYRITRVTEPNNKELNFKKEAIVSPCPTEMTASTILNLIQFALSPSVTSLPSAAYDVNFTSENPIELSARLAAEDVITFIKAN